MLDMTPGTCIMLEKKPTIQGLLITPIYFKVSHFINYICNIYFTSLLTKTNVLFLVFIKSLFVCHNVKKSASSMVVFLQHHGYLNVSNTIFLLLCWMYTVEIRSHMENSMENDTSVWKDEVRPLCFM